VETLWAICVALDVPFSRLLDPPRPYTQVIRAHEGPTIAAAEADYLATLLAACPPGARRDIYRIQADPGHPRVSEPHNTGVVEHVVIGAGRALVGVTGEPAELAPGDYIRYPGDVAHVFEALEPGDAGRPALRTRLGLGWDLLDQRGQAGLVEQVSRADGLVVGYVVERGPDVGDRHPGERRPGQAVGR
jgi:mannose-6-phosphate isomerase-like protein (cupin superfamily)